MTGQQSAEAEYRAIYEHPGGAPSVQSIPEFAAAAFRESGWRIERR